MEADFTSKEFGYQRVYVREWRHFQQLNWCDHVSNWCENLRPSETKLHCFIRPSERLSTNLCTFLECYSNVVAGKQLSGFELAG